MTANEFTAWATNHGVPDKTIQEILHYAATPEEMKAAYDAVETAPPVYSLEDIVGMTDDGPFEKTPQETGFILVGACDNGDPIAIDVANEPGSVWYIGHETAQEEGVRGASIRVASHLTEMWEGIAAGTFPFDYYEAKERNS